MRSFDFYLLAIGAIDWQHIHCGSGLKISYSIRRSDVRTHGIIRQSISKQKLRSFATIDRLLSWKKTRHLCPHVAALCRCARSGTHSTDAVNCRLNCRPKRTRLFLRADTERLHQFFFRRRLRPIQQYTDIEGLSPATHTSLSLSVAATLFCQQSKVTPSFVLGRLLMDAP